MWPLSVLSFGLREPKASLPDSRSLALNGHTEVIRHLKRNIKDDHNSNVIGLF